MPPNKSMFTDHFNARGGKRARPNFIKKAIEHPGALHRALGVPQGKKIPAKKVEKATHSDNDTLRREANLAQTLAKLRPKGKGR